MSPCEQERKCFNCGYYHYDTFHNVQDCDYPGQAQRCPMDGYGCCENWVCQHVRWCEKYSEQIVSLEADLDNTRKLYEAEKLLRLEAEKPKYNTDNKTYL